MGYDKDQGWGIKTPVGELGGNDKGIEWKSEKYGSANIPLRDLQQLQQYKLGLVGPEWTWGQKLQELDSWSFKLDKIAEGSGDENKGGAKSVDGKWTAGYDVTKGVGMTTPFGEFGMDQNGKIGWKGQEIGEGGGDENKGGWKSSDGKWSLGYDMDKGWGIKTPVGEIGGNDDGIEWKSDKFGSATIPLRDMMI